jgi:hypothetical protein
MTLDSLFTGNMGRVVLTRVAVRLRKPELLKMTASAPLDPAMIDMLIAARDAVKRG